jgi:flagellar basal-body rod protein FlgC
VFEAVRAQAGGQAGQARQVGQASAAVKVAGIVENQAEPEMRYEPGNPLANSEGYVYAPNVNTVEEMVDMISASRAYQNNIEVLNTSKELLLATLRLGQ